MYFMIFELWPSDLEGAIRGIWLNNPLAIGWGEQISDRVSELDDLSGKEDKLHREIRVS